MSETNANPKQGGGRTMVYIGIAIVILAAVFYAVTSYQASQAPAPQAAAEEPAPQVVETEAPAPAPKQTAPVSAQDLQVQPDWY